MNDQPTSTSGELHVPEECSEHTGLARSWCTITSSKSTLPRVSGHAVLDPALAGATS